VRTTGYRFRVTGRSIVVYACVCVLLLVLGIPLTIYLGVTRRVDAAYGFVRWWLRRLLRLAGVRVNIRGLEHVPDPPVLFMANHQSMLEPVILLTYLPHNVRVFPKKELFRIPIMGHLMRLAGFIPVDRQRPERARRDLTRALEMFPHRISFMIFPEGTRTRDGHLQPFKRGGFVLAIHAQVPIVPISIWGAYEMLPKGEWRIRPGVVHVVIHPPVATRGLGIEDRFALADRVRAIIASALPERYQPRDRIPASSHPQSMQSPYGVRSDGTVSGH